MLLVFLARHLLPPPLPRPCFGLQVRVVEFNASTPFKEQLETIAATSVLVSVHTSNLANAQFLQPGSAVFEIIQRNWFWHGLDRSFQASARVACRGGGGAGAAAGTAGARSRRRSPATTRCCKGARLAVPPPNPLCPLRSLPVVMLQVQTAMMGDIHHYALRCRRANETVYIQVRGGGPIPDHRSIGDNQ